MCSMVQRYCPSRSMNITPTVRLRLIASAITRCSMTVESLPPLKLTQIRSNRSNVQAMRSRAAVSTSMPSPFLGTFPPEIDGFPFSYRGIGHGVSDVLLCLIEGPPCLPSDVLGSAHGVHRRRVPYPGLPVDAPGGQVRLARVGPRARH